MRSLACSFALILTSISAQTPEGDALFAKQDWAGAAREFSSATRKNAKDGRAWFRLGACFKGLGKFADARDAFQHALDNNFSTPFAMAEIALASAAQDQPDQAVEWLNKAASNGFSQLEFVDADPHFTALKDRPGFVTARNRIALNGKPCLTQAEYRQFDFWVGEWDVQVSGKTVARSSIQRIEDGCIIQENWMPFKGVEGKSWNFYNSATRKWEQVWMSAGSVLKLQGELKNGAIAYTGLTPQTNGPAIHERLTFTPIQNKAVHQFWEQSTDGGKTWKVAFDGIYLPH